MNSHWWQAIGLDQFRAAFPGMRLAPSQPDQLVLVGEFDFEGTRDGTPIADTYNIEVQVPRSFPADLPRAFERGGRIASTFHTNPDGGDLCLGSPLRLAMRVAAEPTLVGYADRCLVPYLYAHSHLMLHGELPWDDLPHGDVGVVLDCMEMFRVRDPNEVIAMFLLMSLRRRVANKQPCPCKSGRRLGTCHARTLSRLRRVWSRKKFRSERPKMEAAQIELALQAKKKAEASQP